MADTNTTGRQDGTRKMSSLIEDMARAICHVYSTQCDPDLPDREAAKAALAVMLVSLREPSEEMLWAGISVRKHEPTPSEHFSANPADWLRPEWQAMLSQWVKEQGL